MSLVKYESEGDPLVLSEWLQAKQDDGVSELVESRNLILAENVDLNFACETKRSYSSTELSRLDLESTILEFGLASAINLCHEGKTQSALTQIVDD